MGEYAGECHFCHRDLYYGLHDVARPVRGWEPLRGRGGANRIIDRRHSTRYVAHVTCVEKAAAERRAGLNRDQGGLW